MQQVQQRPPKLEIRPLKRNSLEKGSSPKRSPSHRSSSIRRLELSLNSTSNEHRASIQSDLSEGNNHILAPIPPEESNVRKRRVARRSHFPRADLWKWKESKESSTMEVIVPSGGPAIDNTDNKAFRHRQRVLGLDAFTKYENKKQGKKSGRGQPKSISFLRTVNVLHKKARKVRSRRRQAVIQQQPRVIQEQLNRKEERTEDNVFVTKLKQHPRPELATKPVEDSNSESEDEFKGELDDIYFGESARKKFFQLHHEEVATHAKSMKVNDRLVEKRVEDDPRKLYLAKCRELDLLPEPMQMVRKQKSTTMALQHYYIGDKRAEAIAEGLRRMPKDILASINMSSNRLTWKGLQSVVKAMEQGAPIVEIIMASNRIGPRGALVLGMSIATFSRLRVLNLSDNHIGDTGAEGLCRGIAENHSIEQVYLKDNKISSYGADKIAELLCSTTTIKEMDLSWNSIRGKGANSIAFALQENTSLRYIDLSWNSFGVSPSNQIAKHLAEALTFSYKLSSVLLSHNKFDLEAMSMLLQAMTQSTSLRCLHLDNNDITFADFDQYHIHSREHHSWIFTRILNDARVTCTQRWTETEHCYKCESWRPVKFIYRPLVSGPMGHSVKLLLWSPLIEISRFDMSWDDQTESKKVVFSATIYVPLTEILFSFEIDGLSVWAADHPMVLNLAKESLRRNLKSVWQRFDAVDFQQFYGPTDLSRVNVLPSCLGSKRTEEYEAPTSSASIFAKIQGPNVYLPPHIAQDVETAGLLRLKSVPNEIVLGKLQSLVQEYYPALHEIYRYIISMHSPLDQPFTFSCETWLNALCHFGFLQQDGSEEIATEIFTTALCCTQTDEMNLPAFLNACVQLTAEHQVDVEVPLELQTRHFMETKLFPMAKRDLPSCIRGILQSDPVMAIYHAHLPSLTEVFDQYCEFHNGKRMLTYVFSIFPDTISHSVVDLTNSNGFSTFLSSLMTNSSIRTMRCLFLHVV